MEYSSFYLWQLLIHHCIHLSSTFGTIHQLFVQILASPVHDCVNCPAILF